MKLIINSRLFSQCRNWRLQYEGENFLPCYTFEENKSYYLLLNSRFVEWDQIIWGQRRHGITTPNLYDACSICGTVLLTSRVLNVTAPLCQCSSHAQSRCKPTVKLCCNITPHVPLSLAQLIHCYRSVVHIWILSPHFNLTISSLSIQ